MLRYLENPPTAKANLLGFSQRRNLLLTKRVWFQHADTAFGWYLNWSLDVWNPRWQLCHCKYTGHYGVTAFSNTCKKVFSLYILTCQMQWCFHPNLSFSIATCHHIIYLLLHKMVIFYLMKMALLSLTLPGKCDSAFIQVYQTLNDIASNPFFTILPPAAVPLALSPSIISIWIQHVTYSFLKKLWYLTIFLLNVNIKISQFVRFLKTMCRV